MDSFSGCEVAVMTEMHAHVSATDRCRPVRTAAIALSLCGFGAGGFVAWGLAYSTAPPFQGVYREQTVAISATDGLQLEEIALAPGSSVEPGSVLARTSSINHATRTQVLRERHAQLASDLQVAEARAAVETRWRTEELARQELDLQLRYAELLRQRLDLQVRRASLRQDSAALVPPIAQAQFGALQTVGTSDVAVGEQGEGPRMLPALASSDDAAARRQMAEQMNEEEVLATQLALCEDRLQSLATSKSSLNSEIAASLGIERLTLELSNVAAQLNALEMAPALRELSSQVHGRVGIYRHAVGDRLLPGETLVEVFDNQRPYVLLSVDLRQASRLNVGQQVELRFDQVEERKPFFGVVAQAVAASEQYSDTAGAENSVNVEIHLTPVGRLWPTVLPGTRVTVRPVDR